MSRTKVATHEHETSRLDIIRPTTGTEKFRMRVSEEAMKLFTDSMTNLYPKPIESTVREIISNAMDATSILPEADRRPVEITSPSLFSASFVVRDHGIGMSPETVKSIYAQYGESTKRENMNTYGAYGLGAKSPLAYCQEFTVVTTHQGVTTHLLCGRDEMGNFGEILSVENTGAESGTVVTIPLNNNEDAIKFSDAINRYRHNPSDVEIIIDSKKVDNKSDFYEVGEIVLDTDDGVTGKLWIHREDVVSYTKTVLGASYNTQMGYTFVLGGWDYPKGSSSGYYKSATVYVELKPGVVSFASSRDDITSNDRYYNLVKRLDAHFNVNSTATRAKLQKRVLELFRTELEPKVAMGVLSALIQNNVGSGILKLGKSTITLSGQEVALSEFVMKDGYNYLEELVKARPLDLHTIAFNSEGNYGSLYNFNDFNYAQQHDKINATAAKIEAMVADPTTMSLARYMLIGETVTRHYSDKSLTIVENANIDSVQMMNRRRRRILSNGDPILLNVAFLNGKVDADTKKIIKRFGYDVQILSNDDFIATVEKIKAPATAAIKRSETPVRAYLLSKDGSGIEDIARKVAGEFNRNDYDNEITQISDLAAKNATIVLANNLTGVLAALRGALNSEVDFSGSPVYAVLEASDMVAGDFDALNKHGRVVVHATTRARQSAAFTKLVTEHGTEADALRSDLDKISVKDARAARTVYGSALSLTAAKVLDYGMDSITNSGLKEVVKARLLAEKRQQDVDFRKIVGLGVSAMDEIAGADFAEHLTALGEAMDALDSYWMATDGTRAAFTAMSNTLKFDDEMTKTIRAALAGPLAIEVEKRYAKAVAKAEADKADTTAA